MSAPVTQHVVVMGVSGCGKTTVAESLAAALGWPFDEGDQYHPQANIDKMAAHVPLTDADRQPWLHILAERIAAHEREGRSSILSCSSLKRPYRDLLRGGAPRVRFLHLHGDRAVLAARLAARTDHFFPPDLLDSQFAALEPLGTDEDGSSSTSRSTPERRLGRDYEVSPSLGPQIRLALGLAPLSSRRN